MKPLERRRRLLPHAAIPPPNRGGLIEARRAKIRGRRSRRFPRLIAGASLKLGCVRSARRMACVIPPPNRGGLIEAPGSSPKR